MEWCDDDSPVNSDEEIERMQEEDEMVEASLLHQYMQWQEIFGVNAFLEKKRNRPKAAQSWQQMERSQAGAWLPCDEVFEEFVKKSEEKSEKTQENKKKKG